MAELPTHYTVACLDGLLGDWLYATDMPAFHASPVEAFRIGDDDDGTRHYQPIAQCKLRY